MRFDPPPKSSVSTGLLPMINVVFLLLIFFLIAGEMQQADPLEITPPDTARAEEAKTGLALYLDPEGQLAFRDLTVPFAERATVLARLATEHDAQCQADAPCAAQLLLHADRGAPARLIAQILPELGAIGFAQVNLVTAGRGTSEAAQP
ncbi:ExbD/TolR family protein [Celeribacter neptunius]|uniref:Biopolymer transport protein ExbD n=1 Tax=Celeribacter neptunius TaxID=588602 RepID=A0A1I3IMB8_9RHOB|nr:biopolymer transporter ExbD [Celeribacter neptunius]SFI49062.1 biopolymer transport protein ExbD [Celeribacter neptunius]